MAFKQKSGSPFQRNFGIGSSPVKHKAAEGEISPVSGATAKQHNKTYGTPKHHDSDERKNKMENDKIKDPVHAAMLDPETGNEEFGYEDETNVLPMKSPLEHEGEYKQISSTDRRENNHNFRISHNGKGYTNAEMRNHIELDKKGTGSDDPQISGDITDTDRLTSANPGPVKPLQMKSSGFKMTSPMKQDERPWWKKGWDEVTQIGEGLGEAIEPYTGDYTDKQESLLSKFNRGYSKEEKADDPVYQAELLEKKELALDKKRKIKKEADIQNDIDREANLKKTLEQSKGWDAETKAKYLDEDGNIKPEYLEDFISVRWD